MPAMMPHQPTVYEVTLPTGSPVRGVATIVISYPPFGELRARPQPDQLKDQAEQERGDHEPPRFDDEPGEQDGERKRKQQRHQRILGHAQDRLWLAIECR